MFIQNFVIQHTKNGLPSVWIFIQNCLTIHTVILPTTKPLNVHTVLSENSDKKKLQILIIYSYYVYIFSILVWDVWKRPLKKKLHIPGIEPTLLCTAPHLSNHMTTSAHEYEKNYTQPNKKHSVIQRMLYECSYNFVWIFLSE